MGGVGWATPASGLSTQFVARSGFCIWVKGSTGDSEYMTIPKQSSKYYYYSANDVISSIYEDITRPSDYYKLAFIDSTFTGVPSVTLNSTNSQLGLAGNPFMTTLYMTQFFADNPHLTGSYWVLHDNALEACTASGERPSGKRGVVNVPMMQSFFVETDEPPNFSLTGLLYCT